MLATYCLCTVGTVAFWSVAFSVLRPLCKQNRHNVSSPSWHMLLPMPVHVIVWPCLAIGFPSLI